MILYKKGNNTEKSLKQNLLKEPYLIINILLAGVIILVMIYSGIFSPDKDDYPVTCIHEKLTGQPCVSCGLSHSFSLIVRGRIGGSIPMEYLWYESIPIFLSSAFPESRIFYILHKIYGYPQTAYSNRFRRLRLDFPYSFLALYCQYLFRFIRSLV